MLAWWRCAEPDVFDFLGREGAEECRFNLLAWLPDAGTATG